MMSNIVGITTLALAVVLGVAVAALTGRLPVALAAVDYKEHGMHSPAVYIKGLERQ
jgi:hypothetical protein